MRSFTSFRHRLLPCTEGTDQTDDDSSSPKDDPHFRSRDQTGSGNAETLSGGGRNEENGGGHDEWYTVILTGHRGVGKTSIVASFLRSDQTSMRDSFASDSFSCGICLLRLYRISYCCPYYLCIAVHRQSGVSSPINRLITFCIRMPRRLCLPVVCLFVC